MKVKRKLKALIAMLICMVTVLGSTMVTQAADLNSDSYNSLNPYNTAELRGQCTWYVWGRVHEKLGISLNSRGRWGDASNWYNSALNDGYSVGTEPRENSIMVWTGGYEERGHVAFVESVNGNSISISEGNYGPNGQYHEETNTISGFNQRYSEVNGVRYQQTVRGFIYLTNEPVTVSLNWSNIQATPVDNNIMIHAEANTNVSGSFTEAGITVWNEAGQIVGQKTEASGVTGSLIRIDYDLINEVGASLTSGANYTYQIYTVFNGTRYETGIGNFRTNGPSVNSWTQELSISDWTYGQEAGVPSAAAQYSAEEYGVYTAEVPQSAGTYYVKASVAEVPDQYTGLEAIKEFHIYKAVPSYTVPENITAVYGQTLADVTLEGRFVWMDNTQTVGDVGEKSFLATYVPEDSINYSFVNNIEIPVIVQPKDLSDMDLSGIDKDTDLNSYELKDGDTVLIKDTDYTITSVKDGDDVTVTVEFMGNYTGTAQTTYSLKDDSQIQTDNKNDNTDSSKNTDNKNTDDTEKEKDSDETKVPQTGDTSPIAVWAVMIALSGLAAGMVFKKRITDR